MNAFFEKLKNHHPKIFKEFIKMMKKLKSKGRQNFITDYWKNETRRLLGNLHPLYDQAMEILELLVKE